MSLVLNVEILGEFKKLTSATQGAGKELSSLNATAGKISKGINKAFATIGIGLSFAVITRELKEATQAAVEDRKSQELLANQLENTIGATDSQVKSIEKQIGALQMATSIADDDLRPSYAQLVRVTKDTSKAMDLLTLATDVSAGSGKDLTSVTAALSKAYQGKFAALTKLGIPMSDSIQNASDYAKEMVKLNRLQADAANTVGPDHVKAMEKVALQQEKVNAIAADGIDWQSDLAGAFANSAEKAANIDPYQRMQIIFGEIQEKLGSALLPVLDQFATWMASPPGQKTLQEVADAASNVLTELTKTAKWAIENKDWLLPLVAGVGVFKTTVTAIGTITAAVNGVTAAVNALKIATGGTLLASLGALGIGAVGAGVGGYQQGTTLGKTADIYSGGAKQTTDPFSGLGKIGNNGFVAPKTTPNVTINVTEPKATAADIIRKLDDYYKATGTRLSY